MLFFTPIFAFNNRYSKAFDILSSFVTPSNLSSYTRRSVLKTFFMCVCENNLRLVDGEVSSIKTSIFL